jgi:hypothetical protein
VDREGATAPGAVGTYIERIFAHCHVRYGSEPRLSDEVGSDAVMCTMTLDRLPIEVGSGVTMCPMTLDLASRLR